MVIQLSCSVGSKPYILCPLIEEVIKLTFTYPGHLSLYTRYCPCQISKVLNVSFLFPEGSWSAIRELVVVNPEELFNFFDISSKDGHYLVLNALLLRRATHFTEGTADPSDTLSFFIDLVQKLKPK